MRLDGRWVIEEKLGEGGMGAVYRGHQKSVSRTVAIKTLRPQLVDSEEFVDRFFREAKIAATISHPNSVTILDYGESDDGTLYLAMEFLDGRAPDGPHRAAAMLSDSAGCRNRASRSLPPSRPRTTTSIVHRDLKPDNIFLLDVPGGATFVKVLDFGIAKMLDSKTQVTKTGMIFGTPEYMSPEQCRGDAIDGRSDLYSLGCILYELVGGRTPFRATTPMAVLMAHVNEAAPPLAGDQTGPHVPVALQNVIMRLLEKNPANRYQTAEELRLTLEQVLSALDGTGDVPADLVPPIPSREMVASPVALGFDETVGMTTVDQSTPALDVRPAPGDTHGLEPTKGRSNAALVIVLLVLLTAVGVAGFAIQQMDDGVVPEPTPTPAPLAQTPPPAPEAPATESVVAWTLVKERVASATAEATDEAADAVEGQALASTQAVAKDKRRKRRSRRERREAGEEPVATEAPEPKSDTVAAAPRPAPRPTPTTTTKPKPAPKANKPRKARPLRGLKKRVKDRVNEEVETGVDNVEEALEGLLD